MGSIQNDRSKEVKMSVQFNKLISRLQDSGSPYERTGTFQTLTLELHQLSLYTEIMQAAVSQYMFTCQQLGK